MNVTQSCQMREQTDKCTSYY